VLEANLPMIVDSGSALISLPESLATALNNLFSPPAAYSASYGAYVVQCNATSLTTLGFILSSSSSASNSTPDDSIREAENTAATRTIVVDSRDLILNIGSKRNTCISGINKGREEVGTLGDTFMRSVLAVFDQEKEEMRFAKRL